MKYVTLVFSILGVLVLHQFLVVLYSFGVTIQFAIRHADELDAGVMSNDALTEAIVSQAAQSLIFAGVVVVALLWFLTYSRRASFRTQYRFRQNPTMIQWFIAVTIGFSALFFSRFIIQGLSLLFPDAFDRYVMQFDTLQQGSPVWFFIAVVVVAPFFEELLFRGFIFQRLERHLAVGVTVAISGVLFGVYHLNIFQGVFASVLGIVLGLSLVWTSSMWIPITIHLVNNAVAFLFSLDAVSERIVQAGWFFEAGTYFMAFVLFPVAVYTLYTERVPFEPLPTARSLDAISLEEAPL